MYRKMFLIHIFSACFRNDYPLENMFFFRYNNQNHGENIASSAKDI